MDLDFPRYDISEIGLCTVLLGSVFLEIKVFLNVDGSLLFICVVPKLLTVGRVKVLLELGHFVCQLSILSSVPNHN